MGKMMGRQIRGRHILAGKAVTTSTVIIDYPLLESGYSVKIYSRSGAKLAEFGDHMQDNPIIEIEFELLSTGCGAFSIVFGSKLANVTLAYNMRVDIHLFGDSSPWYSGYIIKIPKPGTTEKTLTYEGFGFYNQLENTLINQTYANMEIGAIVRDIMTVVVEPDTDIVYNSSKIYSTDYTATSLEFAYVTPKEAFDQLTEFAGKFVFGVDEFRELYFKPVVTEINEDSRYWVGWHVHDFRPEEDVETVKNFLYIKGGELATDGTNILYSCSDPGSIASYGLKKAVLSIPSAMDVADAQRWGDYQLSVLKDPAVTAEVENISLRQKKIKAEGLARVTTEDGLTVYELPISQVTYLISAEDGIRCGMQLGELPAEDMDVFIANLMRNVRNNELIQQLTNKQLSGV